MKTLIAADAANVAILLLLCLIVGFHLPVGLLVGAVLLVMLIVAFNAATLWRVSHENAAYLAAFQAMVAVEAIVRHEVSRVDVDGLKKFYPRLIQESAFAEDNIRKFHEIMERLDESAAACRVLLDGRPAQPSIRQCTVTTQQYDNALDVLRYFLRRWEEFQDEVNRVHPEGMRLRLNETDVALRYKHAWRIEDLSAKFDVSELAARLAEMTEFYQVVRNEFRQMSESNELPPDRVEGSLTVLEADEQDFDKRLTAAAQIAKRLDGSESEVQRAAAVLLSEDDDNIRAHIGMGLVAFEEAYVFVRNYPALHFTPTQALERFEELMARIHASSESIDLERGETTDPQ